jgi:hypothetical protein
MNYFKHIIIAVVSFFILDSLFYNALHTIHMCGRDDIGSLKKLYTGSLNTEVLFVGNSRIQFHINPEIFTETTHLTSHNIGMKGGNIYQQIFTMEEYLRHGTPPKLIFFEIGPRALDESTLRFKKELFKPFMYYSDHTKNLFYPEPHQKWLLGLKSLAFNNRVHSVLFHHLKTEAPEEFVSIKGAHILKGTLKSSKTNLFNLTFSEDIMNKIDTFLDLMESKNIKVVLFTAPYYKTVSFSERNKQDWLTFIELMVRKHEGVTHFNYIDDKNFIDKTSLFIHDIHLNFEGASILSKVVATDLMKYEKTIKTNK